MKRQMTHENVRGFQIKVDERRILAVQPIHTLGNLALINGYKMNRDVTLELILPPFSFYEWSLALA